MRTLPQATRGHCSSAQLNFGEKPPDLPPVGPTAPRWEEGLRNHRRLPGWPDLSGNPDPTERALSPGRSKTLSLQVSLISTTWDVFLSRERGEEEVEGS